MRIGYCSQEQELFSGDRTVGEEFEALGATRDEASKLLKRYLFDRASLDAPTAALSGGERNRLQIARAVFLGSNFLVLDEPTNHLDIESREALEEGLADFGGSMLVVSHDRWFLEKVVDRLVLLEGRAFRPYEGSFGEYWRDIGSSRPARPRAPSPGRPSSGIEGRAASRAAAREGEDIAQRRRALEERITSLEKRRESLEAAAATSGAARDYLRSGRAAEGAAEASRELQRLYADWEAMG